MRRRSFTAVLGGVLLADSATIGNLRAQSRPIVGFLSSRTAMQAELLVQAVKDGLKEEGFIEGENISIEYRWANGDVAALPPLAADLVKRNVTVIVARDRHGLFHRHATLQGRSNGRPARADE